MECAHPEPKPLQAHVLPLAAVIDKQIIPACSKLQVNFRANLVTLLSQLDFGEPDLSSSTILYCSDNYYPERDLSLVGLVAAAAVSGSKQPLLICNDTQSQVVLLKARVGRQFQKVVVIGKATVIQIDKIMMGNFVP